MTVAGDRVTKTAKGKGPKRHPDGYLNLEWPLPTRCQKIPLVAPHPITGQLKMSLDIATGPLGAKSTLVGNHLIRRLKVQRETSVLALQLFYQSKIASK